MVSTAGEEGQSASTSKGAFNFRSALGGASASMGQAPSDSSTRTSSTPQPAPVVPQAPAGPSSSTSSATGEGGKSPSKVGFNFRSALGGGGDRCKGPAPGDSSSKGSSVPQQALAGPRSMSSSATDGAGKSASASKGGFNFCSAVGGARPSKGHAPGDSSFKSSSVPQQAPAGPSSSSSSGRGKSQAPSFVLECIAHLSSPSTSPSTLEQAAFTLNTWMVDAPEHCADAAMIAAIPALVSLVGLEQPTSLLRYVLDLLLAMATLSANLPRIDAAGAIPRLVSMLVDPSRPQPGMLFEATLLLRRMAEQPDLEAKSVAAGVIPALVGLLLKEPGEDSLRYEVTLLIYKLTFSPGAPYNPTIVKAGAVGLLLDLTTDVAKKADTRGTALMAISGLARPISKVIPALVAAGVLPCLVRFVAPPDPPQCMANPTLALQLEYNSVLILADISKQMKNLKKLVAAGAVKAVVRLLKDAAKLDSAQLRLKRPDQLLQWAAYVLFSIAERSGSGKAAVAAAGAVPVLVKLIQTHTLSVAVNGMEALRALIADPADVASRSEARGAGLVAHLVRLLDGPASIEQDMFLAVMLLNLLATDAGPSRAAMAPACSPLARVCLSPLAADGDQMMAFNLLQLAGAALYMLTMDVVCQAALVADGTAALLVQRLLRDAGLIRRALPSTLVLVHSASVAGVMRNLTSNEAGSGKVWAVVSVALPGLVCMLVESLDLVISDLMEQAAGALRNLILFPRDRDKVVLAGGLMHLFAAMRTPTPSVEVLGALRNLILGGTHRDAFIKYAWSDVLGEGPRDCPLVRFLSTASPLLVQEQVAGALKNLLAVVPPPIGGGAAAAAAAAAASKSGTSVGCSGSTAARLARLTAAIPLPDLVALLGSPMMMVQEEAAGALRSLLLHSEKIRAAAVAAGAIPALVKLLHCEKVFLQSGLPATHEHAAGALWVLAYEDAGHAASIVAAGGVEALRWIVLVYDSCPEKVLEQAQGALSAISGDKPL